MPPRKEPQPSPVHIATLQAWVTAGAPGPEKDRSILATLHVPEAKPTPLRRQPITALAVSRGGVRALGTFGKITIGKRAFTGHAGKVNALTFSADGNFLLAASGVTGLRGEAVLWNLKTGRRQHTFSEGHRDNLYGAALSPDGTLAATAGYDRRIKLWNTRTGKLVRTLEGHNGPVHGIAFSPDGTVLASAGGDSAVKLWQVASGQRPIPLANPPANSSSPLSRRTANTSWLPAPINRSAFGGGSAKPSPRSIRSRECGLRMRMRSPTSPSAVMAVSSPPPRLIAP